MKAKSLKLKRKSIGLIGCGNMGASLLKGFLLQLKLTAENIFICDSSLQKTAELRKEFAGLKESASAEIAEHCDIIILAVKPKDILPLLKQLRPTLKSRKTQPLLISLAASLRLTAIKDALYDSARVIRAMPNLPCLVGQGMSALLAENQEDLSIAEFLFSGMGKTVKLQSEQQMDAATALGASGPAFIFLIVEALADGGVKLGLSREQAQLMAEQMAFGSLSLLRESGRHPAELKDMVASPAGTTIEGLHVLEREGVRGALISAIEAAGLKAGKN